jgi:hypothetical protein
MKLKPIMNTLLAICVLTPLACDRKEHRSGEAQQLERSSADSATNPALWEPVDNAFKGCEGG